MSAFLALPGKAFVAPRPAVRAGALLLVLAFGLSGCNPPPRKTPMAAPSRPLSEVLASHTPALMAMPGVVGTAEARLPDGRPCILVMVADSAAARRAGLPSDLEGWPVSVEVTGEFHAMPDSSR